MTYGALRFVMRSMTYGCGRLEPALQEVFGDGADAAVVDLVDHAVDLD